MSTLQRVIKYLAMAFAIFLIVSILSGILFGFGIITRVTGKTDNSALLPTNESGEVITDSNNGMRKLSIQQDIESLEIDLTCCSLEIYQGKDFSAETNYSRIVQKQEGKKLKIKDENSNIINNSDYILRLFLPSSSLQEIEINTGAGRFYADSLTAEIIQINLGAGDAHLGKVEALSKLELEVGAGRAEFSQLDSLGKTDVELGAGRLCVNGGKITNADIDLAMGSAEIQGEILGKSEVNVGMGRIKLLLAGGEDRYSFLTSKGLGSVTIGGKSMSDGSAYLDGANKISVECGAGSASIDFV